MGPGSEPELGVKGSGPFLSITPEAPPFQDESSRMCACGHVSLGVHGCARVWARVFVWHCGYISGHECVQVWVCVCSKTCLCVRPGLHLTPVRPVCVRVRARLQE